MVCGEPVRVTEMGEDWCSVETNHGYTGWTRTRQFTFITGEEATQLLPHIRVCANAKHPLAGCFGGWVPGPLEAENWHVLNNEARFSEKQLLADAHLQLLVPYVWGGKTPFGFDCSGLVQFLFHLQGLAFPRDAWQQALVGDEVVFEPLKPNFEAGTLLYFQRPGKKVHHVAIALGGAQFLHASEWVQVSSFEPQSTQYEADRHNTLVLAKKIKEAHVAPLFKTFGRLASLEV